MIVLPKIMFYSFFLVNGHEINFYSELYIPWSEITCLHGYLQNRGVSRPTLSFHINKNVFLVYIKNW